MRFVADAMLGRLARWLRALDHDVLFDPGLDDDDLARLARTDRRFLLTRDRGLCGESGDPDRCVLVRAGRPAGQIRELDRRFDLFSTRWRDRLFTRCMACNTPLHPATPADIQRGIPARIVADPRVRSAGFRACSRCGRVYWEGSHTRRMRRWLERARRDARFDTSFGHPRN